MNSDRIVIRRTEPDRGYYTVEADGKISTFLCWGEMLEQVISLTHPDIKHHRYHARTVEEEEAEERRRREMFSKPQPPSDGPVVDQDFAEVEPAPARPEILPATTIAEPEVIACTKRDVCLQPNGHEGECTDDLPF